MRWITKTFDELTNRELYDYLALRCEVFIVEQNCPYQDPDDQDFKASHLLGYAENGTLAACARIFAPGIVYPEASIGRVIVKPTFRGGKVGHALMKNAVGVIQREFGEHIPIKIGAQQYLEKFYNSHQFFTVSDMYFEDGIPHIKMLRGTGK